MKRIFTILSIILVTAISSNAQSRSNPAQDGEKLLKFYPNPATSFINFDFQKNNSNSYSLRVINFIGKQVFESKNISLRTRIDLSSYNRGVYIYQLIDNKGNISDTGKFQVSK